MDQEIKIMKDEEATPLDWWLLDYARQKLFHPEDPIESAKQEEKIKDNTTVSHGVSS